MKIQFKIHYVTGWGQSLYLKLHTPNQGSTTESEGFVMQCNKNLEWTIEISLDSDVKSISYQYAILNSDKSFQYEYGNVRNITLPISKNEFKVLDYWRTPNGESPFLTAAFTDCFFKRELVQATEVNKSKNLILRINCPQMEPNRHFAIVGNQDALGNWDVTKKVRLDESQFPIWSIAFDATKINFPLEYKYLVVDNDTDEVLAWGGGPNRIVQNAGKNVLTFVTDEHFIRTIPSWKTAGVAIPVFSLRSEDGFGIGEFNDL